MFLPSDVVRYIFGFSDLVDACRMGYELSCFTKILLFNRCNCFVEFSAFQYTLGHITYSMTGQFRRHFIACQSLFLLYFYFIKFVCFFLIIRRVSKAWYQASGSLPKTLFAYTSLSAPLPLTPPWDMNTKLQGRKVAWISYYDLASSRWIVFSRLSRHIYLYVLSHDGKQLHFIQAPYPSDHNELWFISPKHDGSVLRLQNHHMETYLLSGFRGNGYSEKEQQPQLLHCERITDFVYYFYSLSCNTDNTDTDHARAQFRHRFDSLNHKGSIYYHAPDVYKNLLIYDGGLLVGGQEVKRLTAATGELAPVTFPPPINTNQNTIGTCGNYFAHRYMQHAILKPPSNKNGEQLRYVNLDTLKVTPGPYMHDILAHYISTVTEHGVHLLAHSICPPGTLALDSYELITIEAINMRTGRLINRWCVRLPLLGGATVNLAGMLVHGNQLILCTKLFASPQHPSFYLCRGVNLDASSSSSYSSSSYPSIGPLQNARELTSSVPIHVESVVAVDADAVPDDTQEHKSKQGCVIC